MSVDKKKSGKRIKIVQPQQPSKKFKDSKDELKNGSTNVKPEKKQTVKSFKIDGSSIDEGKKMFEWLISPEPVDKFMK